MGIKVNVPSNLDFAELAKQYPLNNLPAGTRSADFLYYFCHELVHIRAMYGGKHPQYGDYFPVCAARLKTLHSFYNQFMSYLVQADVFNTDGWFMLGKKCTAYKFTETYSGQSLRPLVLNNKILSRNIIKQKKVNEEYAMQRLKDYEYLTKWYLCKGFEIDKPLALAWVEQYKQTLLTNAETNGYTSEDIEKKRRVIIDTCEGWKLVIDRISRNDFSYADFTIDDYAGRFHGVLTYMKKELRNYITFRGHKLVSVDIKNCQPYLSIVLLNRQFWLPCQRSDSSIIKLQEINPGLYNELSAYPSFHHTITLLDSSNSRSRFRVSAKKYADLVVGGQFYEFLLKEFQEQLPPTQAYRVDTRDKVKDVVLTLFNCSNETRSRQGYGPSRVFEKLFPDVDRILRFIKSVEHRNLGRILQRVESHLVLRLICGKIAEVKPEIPLFTIHDCIVTTVGNEDLVKKTIEDVMIQRIGVPPRIKYEYWLPENSEDGPLTA